MTKDKVALHIRAGLKSLYVGEVFVSPKDGRRFTLDELQGYVGGNIEIVQTKDDNKVMVINEEGKLKELPVNEKATKLYIYGDHDKIVGDVLLTDKHLVR